MVTRTRRQASVLARLLAAEGAIPIELPAIEIEPSADPAAIAEAIDALSVGRLRVGRVHERERRRAVVRALAGTGARRRECAETKVAAIGPATAEALAERGIVADLVPEEYVAEAVVEALRDGSEFGGTAFLVPRAESARPELVEGLRSFGWRGR